MMGSLKLFFGSGLQKRAAQNLKTAEKLLSDLDVIEADVKAHEALRHMNGKPYLNGAGGSHGELPDREKS